MLSLAAFLCGVLFAAGLCLSGMTQPAKVVGFLDFTGNWDPSLAFVMGGAVLVYAIGYRLVIRRAKPALAEKFQVPAHRGLDRRLVAGSLLFGMGWGLAGFCPGPAIVSLASLDPRPIDFVVAMVLGMGAFHLWNRRGEPIRRPATRDPVSGDEPLP